MTVERQERRSRSTVFTRSAAENRMLLFTLERYVLVMSVFLWLLQSTDGLEEENGVNFGEMAQYRDGDIMLAILLPITEHDWKTGKCNNDFYDFAIMAVEEVNMVVEQVNNDDSLLKGIKLGTVIINTCFSEKHTLKKLILDVLSAYILDGECDADYCSKTKERHILAGLVGGARSSVSMEIAKILQLFKISQISYSSTSPELSDKSRFKYFFRTVPSDTNQTLAMAKFVEESRWNYVSVVYPDSQYGVAAYTELSKHLTERDVCIAADIRIDITVQLEPLKIVQQLMAMPEAKVVFLLTSQSTAARIMKAAHNVSEARVRFLWVGGDSWTGTVPTDITDDSFLDSLDGSVGFRPRFPLAEGMEERMKTLGLEQRQGKNKSLNPWWEYYISKKKKCSLGNERSPHTRLCKRKESLDDFPTSSTPADIGLSVMAFIHALDSYHRDICGERAGLCAEISETTGTNKVASDLYKYLKRVSFPTSEGRNFTFDKNQDGPPIYNILVFDRNSVSNDSMLNGWISAAVFDSKGIHWTNETSTSRVKATVSNCSMPCSHGQAKVVQEKVCCWSCLNCSEIQYVHGSMCLNCPIGSLPNEMQDDCVEKPIRTIEFTSPYAIGIVSVGAFGLACTIITIAVYFKHTETPIVRASGKELSFFILLGAFVTLLNCFPICANPSPLSCGLFRVILSVGPAIMYAGLLMKTFRVVFIFQSKGILSTRTKAYLEPVPLILVTVCVCMAQVLITAIWLFISTPGNTVHFLEKEGFRSCKHLLDAQIFVGLAYPFLIIIICTILATINRNVPTGFRETLFVGFTMYITCVTWISFLPLFFTNQTDFPKKITTVSVALSLSAITVLFCLFAPRCYTMVFYPDVNTAESVMASHANFSQITCRRRTVASVDGLDNSAWMANNECESELRCRTSPT